MTHLQPVLEDAALLLRPLHAGDWEPLYAVAADPLIWAVHPAHDRHLEPVFRRFFDEGLASGGSLILIEKASGAIIGHSRYSFDFAAPGEVEIGWTFLARAHWGGARNRALKRLMLAHAFTFAETVIFRIGETNIRSRRAMEKIGGTLTDRRQVATMAGREVVHVIYAIGAAGFAASPLAQERD